MRLRRWEAITYDDGAQINRRRRFTRWGAMGYYRSRKQALADWARVAAFAPTANVYTEACARLRSLSVDVTDLRTGKTETYRPKF